MTAERQPSCGRVDGGADDGVERALGAALRAMRRGALRITLERSKRGYRVLVTDDVTEDEPSPNRAA